MKEQPEQLDSQRIISKISSENRPFLKRLDIFKSIDSTNSYLLTQAKRRENSSIDILCKKDSSWVCFAEEQTQGRGRQGKIWHSPYAANIYCSLTWSFSKSQTNLSALGLVCGVVLIQCLQKLGLNQGLGLKWPNDILFSGQKLAGILLESLVSPQQTLVVIGIGLNINMPGDANPEWIGVEQALGAPVSRNLAAGMLLDALFSGLRVFENQGLKPFLVLGREHDVLLNKPVTIHTPQMSLKGQARGLNEDGELLLLDEAGEEHCFGYGEVSVRLGDASV